MSLATLVRRMAEAGAPPEAIAIALEEIEAIQSSLDARRAADRDRKRVQREREKAANVTGHSEDCPETVTGHTPSPLDPPKVSPTPPSNNPPLSPTPEVVGRASFPAPDGVTGGQWAAFRKQRKKVINERSYVLLTNKLRELAEDGYPPGEMIDLAIERGWETVFKPRKPTDDRQSSGSRTAQALYGAIGGDPNAPF